MAPLAAVALVVALAAGNNALAAGPKAGKVQIVVWTAPWCGYCQRDKPKLKRLTETGLYAIMVIDYDQNKSFAKRYGVTTLPTYFIVENDLIVFRSNSLDKALQFGPLPTFVFPEHRSPQL